MTSEIPGTRPAGSEELTTPFGTPRQKGGEQSEEDTKLKLADKLLLEHITDQLKSRFNTPISALRKLGRGGMGTVYLIAADGRRFALKVADIKGNAIYEKFQQEVEMQERSSRLDCTARIRASGFDNNTEKAYMLMDYLPGQPLSKFMEDRSAADIVEKVRDVSLQLGGLHNEGIFHLDVKPENVIVSFNGKTYLIDFGLAKSRGDEHDTDIVCGTPLYMSPEALTCKPGNHLSDQYALGLILYKAATGENPFQGIDIRMRMMTWDQPLKIEEIDFRHEYPLVLADVINRCVEVDPAQRFPSCYDVAAELDTILNRDFTPDGYF
jgi:serine/threonine-protein kinase